MCIKYGDDNPYASLNIIANSTPVINGQEIDARVLSPVFLKNNLHEVGGVEANVATGYHAIEFFAVGGRI